MSEIVVWIGWGAVLGGLLYAAGYRRGRQDALGYAISLIHSLFEDERVATQREAARKGLQ